MREFTKATFSIAVLGLCVSLTTQSALAAPVKATAQAEAWKQDVLAAKQLQTSDPFTAAKYLVQALQRVNADKKVNANDNLLREMMIYSVNETADALKTFDIADSRTLVQWEYAVACSKYGQRSAYATIAKSDCLEFGADQNDKTIALQAAVAQLNTSERTLYQQLVQLRAQRIAQKADAAYSLVMKQAKPVH